MTLENFKDANFDNEDDSSMKIFEKSNFRDRAEDKKDVILNSDDSDIKIFFIK